MISFSLLSGTSLFGSVNIGHALYNVEVSEQGRCFGKMCTKYAA